MLTDMARCSATSGAPYLFFSAINVLAMANLHYPDGKRLVLN